MKKVLKCGKIAQKLFENLRGPKIIAISSFETADSPGTAQVGSKKEQLFQTCQTTSGNKL